MHGRLIPLRRPYSSAPRGIFGFFDWIFFVIPKPVIFPILVFVGLEITAQSFHATPVRHYPAVAMACIPALAYLASLALGQILPVMGKPFAELPLATQQWIQTVMVLAGGGTFIVTSVLWATALAHLIDGRVRAIVGTLVLCTVFSWFGIIHSPLAVFPDRDARRGDRQLRKDGRYEATALQTPYHWSAAYLLTAVSLLALGRFGKTPQRPEKEPRQPA